ncbi:DUF6252 family protein [Psychroserpens sp. XS_ASV72]|uniref:DUF6252 family protein n=1 Tax=Psychroserpens sp. XS_ASV72 TaxID=3241293 RepID=UPI003515DF24
MRHFKNFMMLFMALTLVTFTSCSSDDDGGDPAQTAASPGTITAKVNGTTVTSVEIATFATLASGNLQIQGNTGGTSSKAFVMNIVGFDGEGTYPLGGGANIFNVASYTTTVVDLNDPTNPEVRIWQAPYDDTQVGEINISEVTETKIKGTFNFSAKNGDDDSIRNITEGSFNIDF